MHEGQRALKPPIRWARGFFRAWLVLAVLWSLLIGGIGFSAWQNSLSPYIPARAHVFDAGTKLVRSYSTYSPEHDAAKQSAASGLYRHLTRRFGSVEQDFYVPATISAQEAGAMTDGVFDALVNAGKRQSADSLVSSTPAWIAWLLLPPLVLLATGATLRWVFRGFSRG